MWKPWIPANLFLYKRETLGSGTLSPQMRHPQLTPRPWLNISSRDFPGGSVVRKHRGPRSDSWISKIPWSKKWQPTPVLLPGRFHKQRNLVGYIPRGCKESKQTEHSTTTSRNTSPFSLPVGQTLSQIACPIQVCHQTLPVQPGIQKAPLPSWGSCAFSSSYSYVLSTWHQVTGG